MLSAGQRAFCFVRAATDEGIVLTTYGRSSGFVIDPVEKKPLNHFYPGTSVFSLGTAGCNLGCRFCQNWDISKAKEFDRLADWASPEEIAKKALTLDCKSVAFTYNDPIIFAEYAIDTAKACRKLGIQTIAVTNGYITEEARGDFFGAMDAVNIDLKGFTERFYKELCYAHLEPILESIEYVAKETNCWLELTTLLIPGENDSDDELDRLVTWVLEHIGSEVPLHFSAFHPDYKMLHTPATPLETLLRAREIALKAGLRYVYTGNIPDWRTASTWCTGCEALLIERRGYAIGEYRLDEHGRCGSCGLSIPGKFDIVPGHWGNRYEQVRMHLGEKFEPPRPVTPA